MLCQRCVNACVRVLQPRTAMMMCWTVLSSDCACLQAGLLRACLQVPSRQSCSCFF